MYRQGLPDGHAIVHAATIEIADAAMWPQVVGIGIEALEPAEFLTETQKRDILYSNAARFLRLDGKGQAQSGPQAMVGGRRPMRK
jgi:hypothetical protein